LFDGSETPGIYGSLKIASGVVGVISPNGEREPRQGVVAITLNLYRQRPVSNCLAVKHSRAVSAGQT
jgi:hypothetical protein